MAEPQRRENVYSSASSYSTYSREIKYIFNPADNSTEEYADYSQINPCSKQNYLSHTPHGTSGQDNRAQHGSRNGHIFDHQPHAMPLRTGSMHSNASRDRGPISPRMEEELYSPTHYGGNSRKQSSFSDNIAREKIYSSSGTEAQPHPYSRHSVQVWKNNNNNNMPIPLHYQNVQKPSNPDQEAHNRHNRNNGPALNTFQTQHPLTGVHGSYHYQQPNVHHPAGSDPPYSQQPQNQNQTGHDPPYPVPPRYNHQHHARRKTWSPPTLKMSLLNANFQGSRVCYSNDSLDISEEAGLERKSLSEDLDVTPPKLAPISGVLAQKPGPNLIRPIAFKPVQAGATLSPAGHVTRHIPESADHAGGSRNTRPQAVKLDTNIHGNQQSHNGRPNVGAFNSTAKNQHHKSGGSVYVASGSEQVKEGLTHPRPHTSHNHSSSINSSHSSSLYNFSTSSYQNVSNNTYCNLPANSYNMSANSSHLSANSSHFSGSSSSGECSRISEGLESVQPMSLLRVSFHATEGVLQTPSPSDSGVGELEAMLREKDAEINTLREVMDHNERAIFQVYEEKKNSWLHDTQELQNEYECKLKEQSQKSYKIEQALSLQVNKLQQEQKTLQEENAKVVSERDLLKQQVEENRQQISQLKLALETTLADGKGSVTNKSAGDDKLVEGSLDEQEKRNKDSVSIQEELTLKNKELITLKSKLHSFQADMEKKNREMTEKTRELSAKTDEVKLLKDEITRVKYPPVLVDGSSQTHVPSEIALTENIKPSVLGERDKVISGLQTELADLRAQVDLMKEEHEKEREQWLDEKNRVVRYQKQLQLNYVQIQRKNTTLETEVQQLTLELENRDMKLIALTGEESVC